MNDAETKIVVTRLARISERLKKCILIEPLPLTLTCAQSDGETTFANCHTLDYRPIAIGDKWGENWEVAWFQLTADLPESYRNQRLALHIDLGGEGLLFDAGGNIIQGISPGSVFDHDFHRDLVHLGPDQCSSDKLAFWIEASAAGLFGMVTEAEPAPNSPRRYGRFEAVVKTAEMCLFDDDAWQLWLDLETARGIITTLPESSPRRARLIEMAKKVTSAYDRGESTGECRQIFASEFRRPSASSELKVTAVGHAHIDTAWLWPIRESIRKCARTLASQLKLIDDYPDYIFGASQAQHYQFIKDYYPDLYTKIKTAVKAGRWEIQGGMWVEADCNLTSGESLVRQILHGKNFFRDEFGVEVNNLWLPDVFGYSANLPQILQRAGIEYFLTQKMSWSQYNKFPHHTFLWEGIDGSRVLSHFPPEDNYNSSLRPESLMRAAGQFQERGFVDEFISLFGVGDGGGGPKEEHVEFGRRQTDLESVPKLSFDTACNFFTRLEQYRDQLPLWSGELYLELHRGTLTTQARTKRWNRKLENRLRETEFFWSCLPLKDYPSERIDTAWKTLLKNQFHDILPGSSITLAYLDAENDYEQLNSELTELQHLATKNMFTVDPDTLVLFNPSSYPYQGSVLLPEDWTGGQGEESGHYLDVSLRPFEFRTLEKKSTDPKPVTTDSQLLLENDLIRYEFSTDGQLIRACDKEAGRELIDVATPGNALTLYADRPNDWDAWDIDRTYEDTAIASPQPCGDAMACRGEVRQSLSFVLRVGDSDIKQQIVLLPHSKRLDFVTEINWRESHKMLRVAFSVNVRSEQASYDIQYGYLRRPTHRNTSWDLARFEVAGHRYADLSEPDYGVALLNDCKYGYKVLGNVLDLCLLRSPTYPDPDADRGHHVFTYSLLPHQGDLVRSDVIPQAEALNRPPLLFASCRSIDTSLPVSIEGDGIALEVMKKAEKEPCLVIRIVETHGCCSTGFIVAGAEYSVIEECDLMEWDASERKSVSGPFPIRLNPFEIRTFKLR